MQYKVDTIINGELNTRLVCSTRTKAQKYILSKYNAYSKDARFYVRFVHYSNWGKYKRPYNEMTIDSMHVQTKNLSICIELSPLESCAAVWTRTARTNEGGAKWVSEPKEWQ